MNQLIGLPAEGNCIVLEEIDKEPWKPICWNHCHFSTDIFLQVMHNLIRNPNINSSYVFRADISFEGSTAANDGFVKAPIEPRIINFAGFDMTKIMVRTMIP